MAKTRSLSRHSAHREEPRVCGVVSSWGQRLFETHAPSPATSIEKKLKNSLSHIHVFRTRQKDTF